MKRILKVLLLFIAIMSFTVVNASYAYTWTVDGEKLSRGGNANKSGTAKWVESDEYTGGVLVLENYHGGQLKIACYGTGLGHKFAVKLVGDNTVTVENGVGIIANESVTFIGDGSLTIQAAVPIGSGFIKNGNVLTDIDKVELSGNTTMKITPTVEKVTVPAPEEQKEETKEEVKKEEEEESDSNVEESTTPTSQEDETINKNTYILLVSVFVVVLLLVAFLIMKKNKKRR